MIGKNNKIKGFTLVELLAVIVILAIILVIAVPKVMSVIEDSKMATLESTAKMIASAAEKQKVQNVVLGKTDTITCDSVAKINKGDYASCSIEFDNNTAKVTIEGSGKFDGFWVCDGTKTEATSQAEACDLPVANDCTFEPEGELTDGMTYTSGQYIYTYNRGRRYVITGGDVGVLLMDNEKIFDEGEEAWSVKLADPSSTEPVVSPVCGTVNGIPVKSAVGMFYNSNATSVDLRQFDTRNINDMTALFAESNVMEIDMSKLETGNVINMYAMFYNSKATTLDLSNFDTSNVISMRYMFSDSLATSLDLSNFNTENVTNMESMFSSSQATTINISNFDTRNVTNMDSMFSRSKATKLDLSSFVTENVTSMDYMFTHCRATTLNLSNFNTRNVTSMRSMFSYSHATTLILSSFNTSNVTDMNSMFAGSHVATLDLSSFNTSNVIYISYMFDGAAATTGYARTQIDADKFNSSSDKPETLTFTLKPSS